MDDSNFVLSINSDWLISNAAIDLESYPNERKY